MMEQMYRRNRERSRGQNRNLMPKPKLPYQKTLLRQSLFCLVVFVACLMVSLSNEPKMEFAKNAIRLMVETETDFAALPQKAGSFFSGLFAQEEPGDEAGQLGHLVMPVEAAVTSPFGIRTDPNQGENAFHYGVDLAAAEGEKIKCAAQGEALEVSENAEYGKFIIVGHEGDVKTLYAHCGETLPKAGDKIAAGQVIGTVGATGNATGPHLHFEIQKGDTWLNPADFLELSQHD